MQSKIDLEIIKDTIKKEKDGLSALLNSLDSSVTKSLELLYNNTGRIIVVGIGKSGHIGRKIAATFASTGSPSHYINCAEANHGDLGMIKNNDIILALSKSGETSEMVNIINFTKKNNNKIIAITASKDSFLFKNSNIVCLIPEIPEACALNLAPTTSTIMMLALGDSFAMALMARKQFKKNNFKKLHPGGMLGHSLSKIESLMHIKNEMPIISHNCNMREALLEMTSKRFGCVGIIDKDNKIIGIITDGDLRRNIKENFLEFKVSEVMTKNLITIEKNSNIYDAILLMNKNEITALFVSDKKTKIPIGIIHIHDCLKIGSKNIEN